MNVSYDKVSVKDLARMLKLDNSTVSMWCSKGKINYTNISEGNIPRYEISEKEANYIIDLFKQYGKTKAMRHYDKEHFNKTETCDNTIEAEVTMVPVILKPTQEVQEEERDEEELKGYEIVSTIKRIRTIKAKIQELDDEKAGYVRELESLKNDVMGWL